MNENGQTSKLTRITHSRGVMSNLTFGPNERSQETIAERKSSAINTTVNPKDSFFHNNGASTSVNPVLTPSKKLQTNSFGASPCKICDDHSSSSKNIPQMLKPKNPFAPAEPAKDNSHENRPGQLVTNNQANNFNSKSVKVIQRNSDDYRVNPSWHVGSNSNSPRSKQLAPISRNSYRNSNRNSDKYTPIGSQRVSQRIQKVSQPVDCPECFEG